MCASRRRRSVAATLVCRWSCSCSWNWRIFIHANQTAGSTQPPLDFSQPMARLPRRSGGRCQSRLESVSTARAESDLGCWTLRTFTSLYGVELSRAVRKAVVPVLLHANKESLFPLMPRHHTPTQTVGSNLLPLSCTTLGVRILTRYLRPATFSIQVIIASSPLGRLSPYLRTGKVDLS